MYLCKTSSQDPYLYKGSGKRWLNHIKKHNSWIVTCVIGNFETKEELREAGLFYSKHFDVVNNPNWANLTEEKGNGGLVGTGQLGKTWNIKDTSRMKKPKTQTNVRLEFYKKIKGSNNYQFKGYIITPWGEFESGLDALDRAKKERLLGNKCVITDGNTLRKYLTNLDTPLNREGRRTIKEWRGKTPREIGFNLQEIKNED
jgi:hypothetical protein